MKKDEALPIHLEPDSHVCAFPLPAVVKWLVIVAMIGLPFVLAIPFVLQAREYARRAGCISHLQQIGLTCHNFHDSFKRFPASQWNDRTGHGWSWLTYLLPYLEVGQLFDSLDVRTNRPTVDVAMTARPNGFVCFSYAGPAFAADGRGGISNYKAMGATTRKSLAFYDTTASGNAPYATADRHPDGAVFPGGRLRMADFADGISNTVIAAETVEEKAAVWQDGATATLVGFPSRVNSRIVQPTEHYAFYHFTNFVKGRYEEESEIDPSVRTYLSWDYRGVDGPYQDADYVHGASSEHPGVVNHLLGDGGVRSISAKVDESLYFFIVTRNNSDPASEFFVLH